MKTRRGFTFIEVMVALVVVSTVSAAALKLCALAEISLSEVRAERDLIREASSIKTRILTGEISDSGTSGDIMWETVPGKAAIMGESFGRLSFDGTGKAPDLQVSWRDLSVSVKDLSGRERTIVMSIEHENIKLPPSSPAEDKIRKKDGDKEASGKREKKEEGN